MGNTQEAFEPGKGTIYIRFVMGNDGLAPIPEAIARSGFNYRFAVVQDSFVKGCGEMYFDENLWRCLIDFIKTCGSNLTVIRFGRQREFDELSISEFFKLWDATGAGDKRPPWTILASEGGTLRVGMVTEYWVDVGGQQPYSDSYTYAIYSDRELGEEILNCLRMSNTSERWSLELPTIEVPAHKVRVPPIAPGKTARLLAWLRKATK